MVKIKIRTERKKRMGVVKIFGYICSLNELLCSPSGWIRKKPLVLSEKNFSKRLEILYIHMTLPAVMMRLGDEWR